jgi:hypothetical protein
MKTHFQTTHHQHDDVWTFSGAICGRDLMTLHLTPLDRALMEQHNDINDPLYSANMLLVLEMLFRRMAEQQPPKKKAPDQ